MKSVETTPSLFPESLTK